MSKDLMRLKQISNQYRFKFMEVGFDEISNTPNKECYALDEVGNIIGLNLINLPLTNIPLPLSSFSHLQKLRLSSLRLEEFPDGITELKQLVELDLSRNILTQLPSEICKLMKLRFLDLSHNNFTQLPPDLIELPIEIKWNSDKKEGIILEENPLESPPLEIINQGKKAIKNYFDSIAGEKTEKLYEAKLLIVGAGEVGKTCLANKIINPEFDIIKNRHAIQTTRGIETKSWRFNTNFTKDFRVNIWDFGGQEIYHATHQFFLTKRSLYLFVWDARKEDHLISFDYWLNIVKILSKNSPVLIVMNKSDERIKELNQATVKNRFPNIVGFLKVSSLTGEGILALEEQIKKNIYLLPHIGDKWPKDWTDIRRILESDKRDYIEYSEYLKICAQFDLNTERANYLSNYLHDLGVILHFQDDPILQKIVILKPEWGTNAVYRVLDTPKIQNNKGLFKTDDLKLIWGDSTYPQEKHAELLQLMMKFELCFKLKKSDEYIIPELLSSNIIEMEWEEKPAVQFEFNYDFMPAGIITRFIVRMHQFIENNSYWHNGVILREKGVKAFILADPLSRKIRITVSGKGHRAKEFFYTVRHEFISIHQSLNDLEAKEMIPCICDECQDSSPYFYEYELIKRYIEKGERYIMCHKSITRTSIERLINRVLPKDTKINDKSKRTNKIYNSIYLWTGIILLILLAVIARFLNIEQLIAVIIGTIIIYSIIGAFQSREDKKISEKSFIEIIKLAFKQVPFLNKRKKKK